MLKTAEFVSLGHPDKTADYITSHILDKMLEQDSSVRYALEVMVKGNTVILGGEIGGNVSLEAIDDYVVEAVSNIGYNSRYAKIWQDNAIDVSKLKIVKLISKQSMDIYQGIKNGGWGDQGVFVGYACKGDGNMPQELYLTKKLNRAIYEKALSSDNLGLDIKTQITLGDNGKVTTAIVAVPMLKHENLQNFIADVLQTEPEKLIINGTGDYVMHSSIADCGITGRKLACDFYSTACAVGGGSPWGKDAGKADVSLNILARLIAVENLKDNDEVFVYLSSCIGKSDLSSAVVKSIKDGKVRVHCLEGDFSPNTVIEKLELNKPVFAKL